MNIEASCEKSTEVLLRARQQGYMLSPYQLVRWHRAGLLPRPQQYPLKSARGTYSLYPPGTSEQVLLLCSLRKHERRLSHLAWQMWLAGYRVEDRLIRVQLQQAAMRLSLWMQQLVDIKQSLARHDDEQVLEQIERFAEGPLRLQALRRLRKRIGREHFSTFLLCLLDLTREEDGERDSLADEQERQFDRRILARGLGLEKRFVNKQEALNLYLVGFLLPRLRWFFRCLQALDWQGLLEHTTTCEVLQARDDLRNWLMRQANGRHYRQRLPNEYPSFEIDFPQLFEALSMADQALVLLVWLALRTLPSALLDELPAMLIEPTYLREGSLRGRKAFP